MPGSNIECVSIHPKSAELARIKANAGGPEGIPTRRSVHKRLPVRVFVTSSSATAHPYTKFVLIDSLHKETEELEAK